MFKIIGLFVMLFAGIALLRQKWANSRNSGASRKLVDGLKSGQYEVSSFAETLGMNVREKVLPPGSGAPQLQALPALGGKKFREKFNIIHAATDASGRALVIAEAKVTDIIPLYNRDKEVELLYPCWMFLETDTERERIFFRSSMPSDKDHQFMLEDLADGLYDHCFARQGS